MIADAPFKQTCFPQYAVPKALERYGEVADALGLGGKTKEEKVGVGVVWENSKQCCSSLTVLVCRSWFWCATTA